MNSKLLFEGNAKQVRFIIMIFLSSQNTLPPTTPPIHIHKPEKSNSTNQSDNNLTVSSLLNDPNAPRRHSMDTTANHSNNNNSNNNNNNNNSVVKSQSTIIPLPMNNTSNVTDQLLSPTVTRRKSVSSKERLFSVESLNRTPSIKSNEHLMKVATSNLPETYTPKPTTILSVTTPDNVNDFHHSKISNLCFFFLFSKPWMKI